MHNYEESGQELLTTQTVNLLNAVHEAKGRQNTQLRIRPKLAEPLLHMALIQSTDASNRIEGISTTDKRLVGIVSEKVAPQNRAEEEIAGYRDVLNTIHTPTRRAAVPPPYQHHNNPTKNTCR